MTFSSVRTPHAPEITQGTQRLPFVFQRLGRTLVPRTHRKNSRLELLRLGRRMVTPWLHELRARLVGPRKPYEIFSTANELGDETVA